MYVYQHGYDEETGQQKRVKTFTIPCQCQIYELQFSEDGQEFTIYSDDKPFTVKSNDLLEGSLPVFKIIMILLWIAWNYWRWLWNNIWGTWYWK